MSLPVGTKDWQEGSNDLLDRFLDLHPRKIDLSLGRIQDLLHKLGQPQRRLPPTIHVAGTNGKGSTIAFIRAILEAAGQSVHVYTSPHLTRFHERIVLGSQTGGHPVDEAELVKALAACERINAGAPITIFEIATAAALTLFADHPADTLLLEVGLGGRYDATNVLDKPLATIITPVSQDHPEFLGTDLAGIAYEKAGIIKTGVPVVSGWQDAAAFAVIEKEAAKLKASLIVAGQDFNCYEQNGRFVYEDGVGLLDLPHPRLAGWHQHENAAVAIATLRHLMPDITAAAIEHGLLTVSWPARMQKLPSGALSALAPKGAEIWLDGGHNEAAGQALAGTLTDLQDRAPRPLILVCGMLASKDVRGFLRNFRELAEELIAIPIPGEHAGRPADEIARVANEENIAARAQVSLEDALRAIAARKWNVPPRIVILGSLYLAGEALRANEVQAQ